MSGEIPEAIYQSLDDVANVEFKAKRHMLGGTRIRYDAARKLAGEPLSQCAARLLDELPQAGTVFMTTGAGNPIFLPKGETDGPSGTAFLAQVLMARGLRVVLLADPEFLPGIVASFEVLELAGDHLHVEPFPLGVTAGQAKTAELMVAWPDIVAGIFIEKPGPNVYGIFHTSAGKPKDPETVSHLHLLAEALTAAGHVTIGVGDGGNEIGFGRLGRALEADLPMARDCGCGCGGGIINATYVDCLVTAATSNWGAYAVAVAVALRSDRLDSLPDVAAVRRTVEASMHAGANDGYSGENVNSVDGTSLEASEAVYRLCLEAAEQGAKLQ